MIFAGGVVNPPVSFADSPLYTRGAFDLAKFQFISLLSQSDLHLQFYYTLRPKNVKGLQIPSFPCLFSKTGL